jgi:hypothetical protein
MSLNVEDTNMSFAMLVSFVILVIIFIVVLKPYLKRDKNPIKNGDKIQLTWLPNPRNNPNATSCYIGYTGIVTDLSQDNFSLKGDGSWLIVTGKYKYIKVD